jgi:RND family efflux transporter MFP subunit
MRPLRTLAVLLLVGAGFAGGWGWARRTVPPPAETVEAPPAQAVRYHCPMHPDYTSDSPGRCPICGMDLVPIDSPAPQPGAAAPAAAAAPTGAFRVSPERQQLIGVTYAIATSESTPRSLRAAGIVTVDETRIQKVHTRVEGWVDRVQADFTGRPVRAGQQLLTVYSPDLLATQQEYLLALNQRQQLPASTLPAVTQDNERLVAAARRRLQLWNLTDAQLDEVGRTGQPIVHVPVLSPTTGYVMTRNAFPGQRVTPETELYAIADLRSVWIVADVFQADAAAIRVGQSARLTITQGGRTLDGRVTFVLPRLDPATRTLKVRIEAPNPGLVLKPDMYVDVDFDLGAAAPRIVVPTDAVLDSGMRQVVFVDHGDGYLEPRQVIVAERLGDRAVIAAGLAAGERVVASGTFLIDSESQLKAATRAMSPPPGQPASPAQAPPPRQGPPPAGEHRHD